MRGMDSVKTAQHYLDGWTIQYNHFRDHESADGKPPGVKAKVKPPFEQWADVVKGGATPIAPVRPSRPKVRRSKIEPPFVGMMTGNLARRLQSPVPPSALSALPKKLRPKPPKSTRRHRAK